MRVTIPAGIDQWVPFTIHPDGTVTQADCQAPEDIVLAEDEDGQVAGEPEDPDGWRYLTGNTGQYGYHGAIMHPSEYLGGRMLRDLFDQAAEDNEPYTYVCVPVSTDVDPESFGWAIAERTEPVATRPQPQGTIWVCENCAMMRENDEDNDGRPDTEPEPWSLEPATDVTMGLTTEGHECDDPTSGDCDCERREFSWSRCEGCGSTLGGSRYAYTYWA